MNILYTGFNGKTNSSKIILDKIKSSNKQYLKNSFKTSVNQFEKVIKDNCYDLIISFGQGPLELNTIKIETKGKDIDSYTTNYNYSNLKEKLIRNGYSVIVSNDAGSYLCNNIYYNGLKFIENNNLKSSMIFIYIPKIDNITEIDKLAKIFNNIEKSEKIINKNKTNINVN